MSVAVTRTDASEPHPASFRDPHGYLFESEGVLHRAVELAGEPDFQALLESGLYRELSTEGLLVSHEELSSDAAGLPSGAQRVLRPERVPLVSYASEWTFSQLRAAALLTLELQRRALLRGMSLRDASSFNVQFVGVRPVFIDSLSFARSSSGQQWVAYRQFCEHFLGPLALLAWHGHSAAALWSAQIEGVPLATASRLLPATSWLRPGIALHVHLHAMAASRQKASSGAVPRRQSTAAFGLRLVESLRAAVERLQLARAEPTPWIDYRQKSSYTADDTERKMRFVKSCAAAVAPTRAIDLGANDALYASLLAEAGVLVTAVDSDAAACEAVFNGPARRWPARMNTARIDLSNPTPAFGAGGEERSDFVSRYRCDLVLALALVHHLSIAKQIPYRSLARFFAALGPHLIVEYVPPTDPMAARLLAARPDGFAAGAFTEQAFLAAFAPRFETLQRSTASSSGRMLFWMRRRDPSE